MARDTILDAASFTAVVTGAFFVRNSLALAVLLSAAFFVLFSA